MKKFSALILAMLLLSGCSLKNKELEQSIALRAKLLRAQTCSFDLDITADYGDVLNQFSLQCQADSHGNIHFIVIKPDSIAQIEGDVDGNDGKIVFDDTAVFFPLLADNQVTPVIAPWLLINSLRNGYITSAGKDGDMTRLSIDDSYDDDALHLDIWLNSESFPQKADILFRNRKILSLNVRGFQLV